jgi:flagellar motor switch protein FliN/FliY
MSEPHMEPHPQESPDLSASADKEISWEDAMEDLERQKQMLQDQQRQLSMAQRSRARTLQQPAEKSAAQDGRSMPLPNLQFILDIPLQITVELGRKRLLVNDLLQLSQGSVIELSKQIGEPFEVLVNQKLIARGEVVVINDKFGVRITDIISPMERVQQL